MRKDDWKMEDMPEKHVLISLNIIMNEREYLALTNGSFPEETEGRWFVHHENGRFFFHRSWTGCCIFIVDSQQQDDGSYMLTNVTINQDETQYTETDIEENKSIINSLIHIIVARDLYGGHKGTS